MYLKFIFSIASLLVVAIAAAEVPSSYLIPILRNGIKTTRVARNFWSGEYPAPVIDVDSKNKGKTKVNAYKSLRDISKSESCTIENAIYHPWSSNKGSIVDFYQVVSNVEYTVKKDTTIGSVKLKKGDKVSREVYLSEGSCEGVTKGPKKKEIRIEYSCDETRKPELSQTSGVGDKFEEQWVYVNCAEGFKAFVQDKELLKAPGVKEGEVVNYGKVKASDKK